MLNPAVEETVQLTRRFCADKGLDKLVLSLWWNIQEIIVDTYKQMNSTDVIVSEQQINTVNAESSSRGNGPIDARRC